MAALTPAQAAEKINETEAEALSQVRLLLNKLDEDLKAIYDGLGYPANFRSDTVRIINQVRGENEIRRSSEIGALIMSLTPQPEQLAPLP